MPTLRQTLPKPEPEFSTGNDFASLCIVGIKNVPHAWGETSSVLEQSMLAKCANPSCTTPFHYLRDGRLFQMETGLGGPQPTGGKKPAHRVEYFWLCNHCSGAMTLAYAPGKGVVAVPLHHARGAVAS